MREPVTTRSNRRSGDDNARGFLTDAEWEAIGSRLELTPRERDLLRQALVGATEHQMADTLAISRNTVHGHLGRMYRKVGARDRAQLVCCAFRTFVEMNRELRR